MKAILFWWWLIFTSWQLYLDELDETKHWFGFFHTRLLPYCLLTVIWLTFGKKNHPPTYACFCCGEILFAHLDVNIYFEVKEEEGEKF